MFVTCTLDSIRFLYILDKDFGNRLLMHGHHHIFDAPNVQHDQLVRVAYVKKIELNRFNSSLDIVQFLIKRKQICSENVSKTYVKTVRSSSMTMLLGASFCLRCPVSQSIFKMHSLPSLPCLLDK